MVECESRTSFHFRSRLIVLIDTWWNVNQSFGEEQLKEAFRFNRYMVECECIKRTNTRTGSEVLIDTWWNVNKVKAKVFEEGKPF